MYSPKIIARQIDAWVRAGGVQPVYHSVADCERATAHFDALTEYDGDKDAFVNKRDRDKPVEATLTPDEIAWINNERLLSRLDFGYWLARYVWIKGIDDRVTRLVPWKSQEIFTEIVADMEELRFAILILILKARQLGMSRISTLMSSHRAWYQPNRNAFMASSTEQKTGKLYSMIDFVWSRLPWWLQPAKKNERAFRFVEYFNGSGITLQHGQQTTGIARGDTPTIFHLSELAEFDETQVSELVDSSLLIAVHDTPETFGVLEGTGMGLNNWWHKKWRESKAGWPVRRSRLRPVFLPWFVGGLEPTPDWLRAHPVPANYASIMMPWAYEHSRMAREYVLATDYLLKALGSAWQMPIEMIWWYECEREAAIREGRLSKFLQERPANDDEAFQSTNISVFDTETITFYRDHSHRQPLEGCYGVRGPVECIPARLQPADLLIDKGEESVPIRWLVEGSNSPALDFDLVPVRFDGWSLEDDSGSVDKIYVWEKPLPGFEYGLGVDTADGIDKDRTVIEVVRKGSVYGPTKQVAEYASGKMNAIDAWPFVLTLAAWYSTPEQETGRIRNPRIAIDCAGHGDLLQNILRMQGYRNFHPWNDKQIDNRQQELGKFQKFGVFTGAGWFRAGMIEMLVKMLRDCDIEICSPHFVREMQSLQGDEMVQSLRAGYGGHDDRIMALGYILVSLYKFDRDYFRSAKIAAYSGKGPTAGRSQQKQYARWTPGWQDRADTGIYR